MEQLKYCKFCGEKIDVDCVICPKCGKQVEALKQDASPIIINNSASSSASSSASATATASPHSYAQGFNKYIALLLALFLGFIGAHKFYERKFGTGLIYCFTFGGFFIGWILDVFNLLGKPNPYYL